MFLVVGKINGEQCQLNYINGVLSGDAVAIQKAEEENKKDHGNLGMPPSTKSNYLEVGDAAYHLVVTFVFDEIISVEDDDPELPEYVDI
jgi:hypothetical protein